MKNLIYLFIALFLSSNVYSQDGLDESKSLGLVSYLNTIKELSENKVRWSEAKFAKISSKEDTASKKDLQMQKVIKEKYAFLKWKTDLFINQFSADLIEKNSVGIYRKMNKYLSESTKYKDGKIEKYYLLLNEIDETYKELYYSNYSSGRKFIATATEILTLAGFNPYTLYKDIKATKEKKIAILIGFLNEMKLKPLSELKKTKN